MSVADGSHVQISVYRIDDEKQVAYGFSMDLGKELIVRVHENDGVYPGYSLSFLVQKVQGKVVIPVPSSVRVHQLENTKINGNSVELPTMVILSSKSTKDYEFWSPDYGYVLLRDDYHATRDIVYSTYIKRDYSDRAMNGNYLFSICSNLKQVEQGKKDNLLAQLREEEDSRQRTESPAAYGTSGFQRTTNTNERWWDNQGGNGNGASDYDADMRERQMKALANDVTSFLVVSLQKQGAKVFGEAWCSPVRTVVLTCDKFSGSTDRVEIGKWYEGVVKYSKKHYQKTSGFYAEKVWRESESPTTLHTELNGRAIQVYEDLHFNESQIDHSRRRRSNGFVYLKCSSLMEVQMTQKQYDAYEGQSRYCVMQYMPPSSDLCNWKLLQVMEGHVPTQHRQPAEEAHGVEGEEHHGPDRCDEFGDDDSEDSDDEEMVPRKYFNSQPSAGVQRPIPQRPDQAGFVTGNQQQNNFGAYNNKEDFRSYNNGSSSDRGNWNCPNSDSGFVDSTGQNPMTHNVQGQYYADEDEVSDFGVVTEATERSHIIYSNRTQACFVRNVSLKLGDWVQFRAKKLTRKEGGCFYEVIPESVAKTDQLNPAYVDKKYIWMDVTVRMQYGTRPHSHSPNFKVNTSDVGWVSTEFRNECEPEGHITIDQMKEIGGLWRVWVQFLYGYGNNDDYEWWIMRVRGPNEEVAKRDKEIDQNNLGNVAVDQEDLDMDRQKAAAKAQMQMEQMNLGTSTSRSSPQIAPGLFSGRQNTQSPADMNAPCSLSKADLFALWQIKDVRTALKTTDFELYGRVEKSVADTRQTPGQRAASQGLPMTSQHSNQGLPMTSQHSNQGLPMTSQQQQQQNNANFERIRSGFAPSNASPASSVHGGFPPQQNQYRGGPSTSQQNQYGGPSSSQQNQYAGPSSSQQGHYGGGPSSSHQNYPPSGGFNNHQNYNNNRFM